MSVWAVDFDGDTDPRDYSPKAPGFLSGSPTALRVGGIRRSLETPVDRRVEARAVEARSNDDDVVGSRARGSTGAMIDGKGPKTTSIDSGGGRERGLDWTSEDKASAKVGSARD